MAEDKKERITHLYHGDRWVYLRSNQKEVQSQSVLRSEEKEFPRERLDKWMTEDDKMRRVISVTYGADDKCFVCICNRYEYGQPQVGEQNLFLSPEFPNGQIREAWKKGHRVNVLNYCRDIWVLITEQLPSTKLHGQGMSIFKDLEDLKSEISDWWGKNKTVEILSYGKIDGDNQMVMISHQKEQPGGQGFYANSDWPLDKISEYYKKSKYISSLIWHAENEYWVYIMSPNPGGQSLFTGEEFPVDKISNAENVFFYGKRW